MTYSICARDAETGELGVAVQSCMFGTGVIVPWARPGVGAVATQAFAEAAYGPRCLDALAAGASASEALDAARALDGAPMMRQVGVVAADGSSAAFTGELCIAEAGDARGDGYVVQANMMASARVWPAMASAFESARGALAERLVAALVAAEDEGGDARGAMSAALVVVGGEPASAPAEGVRFDLRVEDSSAPLDELARLVRVSQAFHAFERGEDALLAGDPQTALRELDAALAVLPDDENFHFAHAGALLFCGRTEDALSETRALVAHRPSWATIIRSFVAKGLFPVPPGLDVEAELRRALTQS